MWSKILIIIGLGTIFAIWINGGFDKYLYEKVTTPAPIAKVQTLPIQAGLPKAVEDKRQAIFRATLTRDYDKLEAEASPDITYTLGYFPEGGFAEYLQMAGKDEKISVFDLIPKLLKLPYAKIDDIYVWPAVFAKSSAEWTASDIAQMKTLLTDEQIEGYREFGGYAYYRLGIKADGSWTFYIAGD